ncbi:GNAT family N-acetyltransferase [Streptomyces sp. NPDC006863]|uniref:GNAT family N-acetyltransferase n=1 Tax=Streptomyces sp. NPDC006863 TaxID=3154779 RepID=UPI0033D4DF40
MTSHVEQQIQARIAAARAKREQQRQQRAELTEARTAGLAARHRTKLQRQAEDVPPTPPGRTMTPASVLAANKVRTVDFNPRSYTHIRSIAELHKAYLLEEFERTGDYAPGLPVATHTNTLIIRVGDEIGGFCAIDPHHYALELVYLAPPYRGRGIAAALIQQMRATCPQRMKAKLPFTPQGQALVTRTGLLPLQPSDASVQAAADRLAEIHRVIRRDCPHKRGNPAKPCRRCWPKALRRSTEYALAAYLAEQRDKTA